MSVAAALRAHKQEIGRRWEAAVLVDSPPLRQLTRSALVDHLPEFLEGLAEWVDGDEDSAVMNFGRLVEGHALQRQSSGIPLEALTSEYSTLRVAILETLRETTSSEELAAAVVSVNAGIDRAVNEAIRRYAMARDHVRERFIGILGHDLRDPLGAVMMSSSLLASMTLSGKQAELVGMIARGAKRIERMIDDVLDFARGRLSGRIPITPVLADLGEICHAVVGESRAVAPDREIAVETSGDLRVHVDRERLDQALGNLVSNARHYGADPLIVRAWEREDKHAVLAAVTNHGPPIPKDVIARIFDPFARATVVRRDGGLGLGLYIVDQIALAHGGTCTVRSTAEEGTTFTIELPRVPLHETPGRPAS
jgi:signal transduction histidine kinase